MTAERVPATTRATRAAGMRRAAGAEDLDLPLPRDPSPDRTRDTRRDRADRGSRADRESRRTGYDRDDRGSRADRDGRQNDYDRDDRRTRADRRDRDGRQGRENRYDRDDRRDRYDEAERSDRGDRRDRDDRRDREDRYGRRAGRDRDDRGARAGRGAAARTAVAERTGKPGRSATSAATTRATSAVTSTVASAVESRGRMRVAPPEPVAAPRTPFVLLVLALVAGGIVGLLVLNTAINADAFKITALKDQQNRLDTQEQQLNQELAELQSPGNLQAAATRLGLVPAGTPAYIQLPDGRILNVPQPAGSPSSGR